MPKHKLKHYLQKHFDIENNSCFKAIRPLIKDRNLWHLNRYSFAAGIAIGVFAGWIPIPFHTVLAIIMALIFDCNVPLSIIAIWVANPFTMPEMYFFAYELGTKILGISPHLQGVDISITGFLELMTDIWEPLILGCLLCALVSAVVVYIVMSLLWAPLFEKHLTYAKKHKTKKRKQ